MGKDKHLELNFLRFDVMKLIDQLKDSDLEQNRKEQVSLNFAYRFQNELPKIDLVTPKKRVLCFAANPKNTHTIRVYPEMRDIATELFHSNRFEFIPAFATRKKGVA